MEDFIPVREARVLVTFMDVDKVKGPAKKGC